MDTRSKLIMVVDDEPAMSRILQRLLTGEGYRVITARDGEQALKALENNVPDAVLLDLMMPGMSGREICRRIKETWPQIKVIYLSAQAPPRDLDEFKTLQNEADGYITKPASGEKILSTLEEVLAGS